MPVVQFGLQPVALGQQREVLRREVVHDRVEAFPEMRTRDADRRQQFMLDEVMEFVGHLKAVDGGAFCRCCH